MPELTNISPASGSHGKVRSSGGFPWSALNIPLLVVVALLTVYGLVVVFSAVSVDEDYNFSRQLLGVAIGLIVMAAIWAFDYRRLSDFTTLFLVVTVVLILSPHLPVIGVTKMGATSWIRVGMEIQPGEFAKITVILLDAAVMARYGGKLDDLREYCKAVLYILVPFACIMTQPDLGTGLVYLFIGAAALVVGGARPKYLLVTLAVAVGMVALVFVVDEMLLQSTGEYKLLKQYQRDRLLVFMNQDSATLEEGGESWNLQQAMIAIGSGGVFGQGYMQGTQHALGLLPEAQTDFIFCVLAEELGFVGVLALLALYASLVIIGFRIASASSDMFGILVVMCIIGMWLFQILENIGMTCGLMPITGIPLPFMSYGSSFMVVNFALLGFMGSVWAHGKDSPRRMTYATSR